MVGKAHGPWSQSWLLPQWLQDMAKTLQQSSVLYGTNIQMKTECRKHLEAPLGSKMFVEAHVEDQIKEWVDELNQHSNVTGTHLHAAYGAYTFTD